MSERQRFSDGRFKWEGPWNEICGRCGEPKGDHAMGPDHPHMTNGCVSFKKTNKFADASTVGATPEDLREQVLAIKLRPKTLAWLFRCGGVPRDVHTSEDYPRELETKGIIERTGPGMLGHLHRLVATELGVALDLHLLDLFIADLPVEIQRALATWTTAQKADLFEPYKFMTVRERGSLKMTHWGFHMAWRARATIKVDTQEIQP